MGPEGPEVFQGQQVVGTGEQVPVGRIPLTGQPGRGGSVGEPVPQGLPPFLRGEFLPGKPDQGLRVPGFAAEGKMGHKAGGSQQLHPEKGEPLGALQAACHRQFQHQVRASQKGQTGPPPLVPQGQFSPLGEAAAHDGDDREGRPQQAPHCLQLMAVAPVKGIVFGHQADDRRMFHGKSPNFYFTNSKIFANIY